MNLAADTCAVQLISFSAIFLTPYNTPEDRRFYEHRGGSLRSRLLRAVATLIKAVIF
jgi:hypothetical protein